jgi:hypothetical protein
VTESGRTRAIERLDCAAADVGIVIDLLMVSGDEWAYEAMALEAKLHILRSWIENSRSLAVEPPVTNR